MIHRNSKESYAAQKGSGRTKHFRRRVWETIRDAGPVTDRQILTTLLEPDVNNIRPEITRLKQDGLIVEIDRVKCPQTKKTVRRTFITGAPYTDKRRPKDKRVNGCECANLRAEIGRLRAYITELKAEKNLLI